MLRLVRTAKNLRHIEVTGVLVSTQELTAILKHIGASLEHFGTSVGSQVEPAWLRLLKLKRNMSDYNLSLQEFTGRLDFAEVEEVSDTQAQEMVAAFRHLLRRAPNLMSGSASSVKSLVNFIAGHQCDDRRCPALRGLQLSVELERL